MTLPVPVPCRSTACTWRHSLVAGACSAPAWGTPQFWRLAPWGAVLRSRWELVNTHLNFWSPQGRQLRSLFPILSLVFPVGSSPSAHRGNLCTNGWLSFASYLTPRLLYGCSWNYFPLDYLDWTPLLTVCCGSDPCWDTDLKYSLDLRLKNSVLADVDVVVNHCFSYF